MDDCPLPFRLKSGLRRHSENPLRSASSTNDEIPDWQQQVPLHLQPDQHGGQQCNSIEMSPRYTGRVWRRVVACSRERWPMDCTWSSHGQHRTCDARQKDLPDSESHWWYHQSWWYRLDVVWHAYGDMEKFSVHIQDHAHTRLSGSCFKMQRNWNSLPYQSSQRSILIEICQISRDGDLS